MSRLSGMVKSDLEAKRVIAEELLPFRITNHGQLFKTMLTTYLT